MKKILISFCMIFITAIAIAQSQSDLDKAMKEMQEMMKTMTPEEQEMVKQYTKGLPTSVEEMKNTKPSAQNSIQAESKPSEIGTKTTKFIGPEGGEIKSANGKIALKFPAGAVAEKTEISIEEIGNDLETGSGNAFQLLPEGQQFNKPVILTLKYTNEEIEGSNEDELTVVTQGKNGDWFLNISSVTDTQKNTLAAFINHFSKWGYGAFSKLKLIPNNKTIGRGQIINFTIEGFEMTAQQNEIEKKLYTEFKGAYKDLMYYTNKQNQEMIYKLVKKIDDLKIKLHDVNKKNYKDDLTDNTIIDYDLVPLTRNPKDYLENYKVSSWSLNGNVAPISNSFGTLTPADFTAKYKAPNTISVNGKTVFVHVNLISQQKMNNKFQKYRLVAKIDLTDENFLNYTLDGKTTNTLQFAVSPTYIKNTQQNAQKNLEAPLSQCFLVDGELIISATSSFMTPDNAKKATIVYFKIKNPAKGQIFLKCDDESSSFRNDTRMSVQTGVTGEQFTNSENLRWMVGNTCDGRDNCVPFEFNITEYNPGNGGTVSGSFSGKVYEDKDMAKSCSNSIEHFISGDFSLKIIKETGSPIIDSNPTKEKASTVYDKPKGDEDLVPLVPKPKTSTTKPTTKPKPAPKPKPKQEKAPIGAWD